MLGMYLFLDDSTLNSYTLMLKMCSNFNVMWLSELKELSILRNGLESRFLQKNTFQSCLYICLSLLVRKQIVYIKLFGMAVVLNFSTMIGYRSRQSLYRIKSARWLSRRSQSIFEPRDCVHSVRLSHLWS